MFFSQTNVISEDVGYFTYSNYLLLTLFVSFIYLLNRFFKGEFIYSYMDVVILIVMSLPFILGFLLFFYKNS